MPEAIYQRPADFELEHEGDRDVELTLLFLVAGFTVESTWGDYRFRPATSRSRDIVMVGVRP